MEDYSGGCCWKRVLFVNVRRDTFIARMFSVFPLRLSRCLMDVRLITSHNQNHRTFLIGLRLIHFLPIYHMTLLQNHLVFNLCDTILG